MTLRSGPSKGCRALAYREDRKDQRHHRGTSDNAIPAIQPGCSAATPASVPCVVPNSPSKPVENVGQCDFEHPSAGSESIRLTPAQSPHRFRSSDPNSGPCAQQQRFPQKPRYFDLRSAGFWHQGDIGSHRDDKMMLESHHQTTRAQSVLSIRSRRLKLNLKGRKAAPFTTSHNSSVDLNKQRGTKKCCLVDTKMAEVGETQAIHLGSGIRQSVTSENLARASNR